MADLIYDDGYRANVGIIISNQNNNLFFAKRRYQSGWQFPQGGINVGETPIQAMYRELNEETGLYKKIQNLLRNQITGISIRSHTKVSEKLKMG